MRVWPAPGKLNLFLHITGRRPDGYHNLQTVFQFLEWADQIRLAVRHDPLIRLRCPLHEVPPEQNLVVRAARRLQAKTGVSLGADIELEKRLPIGGGLGGGSSDAATTLVALNRLWNLDLTTDQLMGLGLELGADVPVFIEGQAAWGEGVGERLSPVVLDEPWYLVVNPGCHVSTAAIFADPELTRHTARMTIPAPLLGPRPRDASSAVVELMANTRNDCEPVVRHQYTAVDEALGWLAAIAPARMTGTGGCVFAPFSSEEAAREAHGQLPEDWSGFVSRGRNHSSLKAFGTG